MKTTHLDLANQLEAERRIKEALNAKQPTFSVDFYNILKNAKKAQIEFNRYQDETLKQSYYEQTDILYSLALSDDSVKADFESLKSLKSVVDMETNLVLYSCCIGVGVGVQLFLSQLIYLALHSNYKGFVFIDKNDFADKLGLTYRQVGNFVKMTKELGIIIPAKYFQLIDKSGKTFSKKMYLLKVERLFEVLKFLRQNKMKFAKFYQNEIKQILEVSPFQEDKERLKKIKIAEMEKAEQKELKKNAEAMLKAKDDEIARLKRELEALKAKIEAPQAECSNNEDNGETGLNIKKIETEAKKYESLFDFDNEPKPSVSKEQDKPKLDDLGVPQI